MSAAVTGKRKRDGAQRNVQFKKAATQTAVKKVEKSAPQPKTKALPKATETPKATEAPNGTKAARGPVNGDTDHDIHLQIITGSYERILHGFSATVPRKALAKPQTQASTPQNGTQEPTVSFSDTFLFAAHASSIRCLAISPPTGSSKRTLATGSTDERINLYSISTSPPTTSSKTQPASLSATISTTSNPANRSLGTLLHHDRPVTALHFPSKTKLFSSAEDSTLAITRSRDWTLLSSIRAPIPKPLGRPSGDTAGPGEIPAGVNAFAVHPSQRLMLSVGRGERCMRLWNLITGKKAGVLNFEREVLGQVGEGKFGTGEGRNVLWDAEGEIFVVGFERGAVVFGINDSKAKAVVKADRPTKVQQMRFLPGDSGLGGRTLAVSTEDGRVLFFDLSALSDDVDATALPQCPLVAQLGGRAAGVAGRIKDFEVLQAPASSSGEEIPLIIVTASSDGAVRIWSLLPSELQSSKDPPAQVGHLVGTSETANRITCLGAFVLDGKAVDETNGEAKVRKDDEAESGSDEEDEDEEDSE